MKMPALLLFKVFFLLFIFHATSAQVAINKTGMNPDPSAILDVSGMDGGILIPRMTEVQRDAIVNPAPSLMIFQTDGKTGFYYNSGTAMTPIWTLVGGGDCAGRTAIDSLPYEINTPGSFYVSTYLVGTAGSNGITINSSNVTLDLNGYTLDGNGQTGLVGILLPSSTHHITIFNGSIVNWGQDGINGPSSDYVTLQNVKVDNNLFDGMDVRNNAIVQNCIATNNGYDGIDVEAYAEVSHCTSSGNSGDGIELGSGSVLSYCTVTFNNQFGINSGVNSNISNCSARSNNSHGIFISSGVLKSNICSNNLGNGFRLVASVLAENNIAKSNTLDGFLMGNDCVLYANFAQSNDNGFHATGDDGRIENNFASDNVTGFRVSGEDYLIIKNSTEDNSFFFEISPNNLMGTLLNQATLNSNSNPNANIEH